MPPHTLTHAHADTHTQTDTYTHDTLPRYSTAVLPLSIRLYLVMFPGLTGESTTDMF